MGTIINFQALATSPLRKDLLTVAEAGYAAIETERVIKRRVRRRGNVLSIGDELYDLGQYKNIYLIGVGKAALKSVRALRDILGERIARCVVLDVETSASPFESYAGTHPYPSQRNVQATQKVVAVARRAGKDDLVIVSISGGGSALLCSPEKLTCNDEVLLTKTLMAKGASIEELNTVRKHISNIKGGGLARVLYPARSVTLLFSDVPGDDPAVIASGPTVRDPTTVADARKVLERYDLPLIPLTETPKDQKYFEKARCHLVVTADTALTAMTLAARRRGYDAVRPAAPLAGEARAAGRALLAELSRRSGRAAVIAGGETVVRVKGRGRGGRNQEVVLGAVRRLKEKQVIAALASDGIDNTDAAGAIADFTSQRRARALKMNDSDYLARNDAYHYFKKLGDLVFTGKTGANVADFAIALKAD